jgi:two-component system nitrogen regulation response regulator NtrX
MKVLIVDDSIDFSTTLADIIRTFNIDSACVNSPQEAIAFMEEKHSSISLILLDIEFGFGEKMTGLDLLEIFRKQYISIPVVMISGRGTIETAVRATKLGAVNFIEKNIITKEKIRGIIDSTINQASFYGVSTEIQNFLESNGIIGRSKAIIQIGESIIRYGRTDLNILITGETGTGKKLVAQAIHSISRRMKANFITVDIPNIPKELFQSELFGHIKGSFSGATDTKKGLFHQADKGTLFLDEIGELSLDLQSNLLIPIEEKNIRKVGAVEHENIDVRFISATDRDLLDMIQTNKFREQLYHRLRECEINIPPLASRIEDIPDIVNHFTLKHNSEFKESKYLSSSAVEYLTEQKWHGNIRELSSFIRVVLQTTNKNEIDVSDMIKISTSSAIQKAKFEQTHSITLEKTLKEDLAEVDRIKIEKTLSQNNGNVSKSAAILGISRETLHNKIRKYEINTQQFRKNKQ